ncbi:MAG TPA: RidA family protein [Gemmatimonadales bacterium]|jgi:2-iminobutanoate/2-iminopropanoate deaminase|nr:RidA family protein [Gemmatimonadales bacterium]
MRGLGAFFLAAALLGGCGRRPSARPVEYIPVAGGAKLPFSAAVRVGPLLMLSGQLGTDSTATLVSGGIQPETRQALENIRRILQANGSSLDHVVKCTVMLADMKEWGAMNEVYVTFFPSHLPARSAFGTSGLARNARVELECWATIP